MNEQTYILTKEQKDGLTDFVRTEMSKRNVGWAQAILHDLATLKTVEDTRPLSESKPVVPAWEELMDTYNNAVSTKIDDIGKEKDRFTGWKAVHTLIQSRTPSVGEVDKPTVYVFEIDDGEGDHEVDFVKKSAYDDLQALIKGGGA